MAAESSQSRSEALPSSRFLHAVATGQPQEAALAVWWRRFRDPQLDALIEATLQQGYAASAAALHLQQVSECSDGFIGEVADDAAREDAALYDFYTVRLRQVALTARHYFQALCLRERIACADAAIAAGSTMLRRAASRGDADHDVGMEAAAGFSPLADLHAHRIRLSAQWDAIAIALAYQVAQPLAVVVARLHDRCLPAATAESPAIGGPDRLRLRRPDLCALADTGADAYSEPWAARMAALVREQRVEQAYSEVELALAALAGAQNELVPVRAALASAEAQYKRLRASAERRRIVEAGYAVHACRDREIETRGRGYLALVDLFHAAGCGWPVLSDPAPSDPAPSDLELADHALASREPRA
jgi:outer membrane protein TolC